MWYTPYLTVYEKRLDEIAPELLEKTFNEIREKLAKLQSDKPVASVVLIAHNEEPRILSCLNSLCNNHCPFPIEILVVNNNSTDRTEEILQDLGIRYFNEKQKGPGFARQCGLNQAQGIYHLCIDSDTLYPPLYIQSMVKALQKPNTVAAYALWSFIPRNNRYRLFIYEMLRDIYLSLQNIKRPELNVRGMVFAFKTEIGKEIGFRTDILRGEDGSLALEMKKHGKLQFVKSRKARVMTGYGTLSADGSIGSSFKKRLIKGLGHIGALFHSKSHYEDEESNLIRPKNGSK